MSIIPQAIAAIIITVLLGVGALFIGNNAPREQVKVHPAEVCITGIKCVGNN